MGGTRIYIGGLSYGVRERDLERFFKGYGRIREILIKNGYGFVDFEDYRDADDAIHELDGKDLLGQRVTVQPATGIIRGPGGRFDRYADSRGRGGNNRYDNKTSSKYGPPTRTEHRLIVENLSTRISWQDLKDYMRPAGEVTYADAHKIRRNEGVVEFATAADMKAAMEKFDDTELNGRRIRLIRDRRALRGGGRRSYSSSRSRSRSPRRYSRSRSRSSRKRSRSRTPKRRSRSSSSKSRAGSKSKSRRTKSKSPVKSRSRSWSAKRDGGKSKSRRSDSSKTPVKSRSRSWSTKSRDVSKSKSPKRESTRSRSRSRSEKRDSRSRSRSDSPKDKSRSRSRSSTPKNGMSPEKKNDD